MAAPRGSEVFVDKSHVLMDKAHMYVDTSAPPSPVLLSEPMSPSTLPIPTTPLQRDRRGPPGAPPGTPMHSQGYSMSQSEFDKFELGRQNYDDGKDRPEPEREDCQAVLDAFLPESLRFWEGIDVLEKPVQDFEKMMSPLLKSVISPGVNGAQANFAYYHKVVLNQAKFSVKPQPANIPPAQEARKELFDLMAELSTKRAELDKNLKAWTAAMEETLAMSAACTRRREDYRTAREVQTVKVKKYLNTRPDHHHVASRDEKMMKFKRKMEMDRYDLRDGMARVLYHRYINAFKPVSSVMRAYLNFFEEGYALIKPLQGLIEDMEKRVAAEELAVVEKDRVYADAREVFKTKFEAESQIEVVAPGTKPTTRDFEGASADTTTKTKQGYLYVHQPRFAQVWVELKDGQLFVKEETAGGGKKEKKEPGPPPVVYSPLHLLLCTVKTPLDAKLRFAFDVISAGSAPLTLQADCQKTTVLWETAIQNAISYQLNNQASATPADQAKTKIRQENLQELWAVPGNSVCADCQHAEPDWVSLNLGILICKSCSGFHRSLGVHISQVRSLTLDDLDAHRLRYISAVGNIESNQIWEAEMDPDTRPKLDGPRADLEKFVKHKYAERGYVRRDMRGLDQVALGDKLMDAVRLGDPIAILSALAWGAEVNAIIDESTPLLQAVKAGNQLVVDQLYLNGAQLTKPNKKGWTALHVAAETGDCEMVDLLLLRGGRDMIFAQDEKGITPADRARLAHGRQDLFTERPSDLLTPDVEDEIPPAPGTPPAHEIEDDEGALPLPPAAPNTSPHPSTRGGDSNTPPREIIAASPRERDALREPSTKREDIPLREPSSRREESLKEERSSTLKGERDIVEMLQNLLDSETKRRTKKLEQEIREESERAAEQAELEAAQLEEAKNSTSAKWKGLGAKLKLDFTSSTKKGLATVGAKMAKSKGNLATKYRSPAGPPTPGGMFRAEHSSGGSDP